MAVLDDVRRLGAELERSCPVYVRGRLKLVRAEPRRFESPADSDLRFNRVHAPPGPVPMSSGAGTGRHLMSVPQCAIRVDMTVSLDGFVVGPQDGVEQPMGIGGFRLFNWLDHRHEAGPNGQVFAESMATRAVIAGRRTYEHAGRWNGDHHDGVPVFVLTHHVPEEPPPGCVRYVTDVASCATQARAAAGDADVVVLGAGAAQALLRAGEVDEMELHVVPVLLGQGRRLFDDLPAEPIELELTRGLDASDTAPAHRVLHLRYRVQRPAGRATHAMA